MCIAFPGLVVGLDASGAIVETERRRRRASVLLVPEVAVGDWVTVAAGTIVERLDPAEAAQIRAILQAGIALELAVRPTSAVTDHPEGAPDVHPS